MWRSTQCPNTCYQQAYKKGVATIRKLILHMYCKNRRSNTCPAGATAVVCPMSAFIDRPSWEQEEARPEPNHTRMLRYQGYTNGVTITVLQYCSEIN